MFIEPVDESTVCHLLCVNSTDQEHPKEIKSGWDSGGPVGVSRWELVRSSTCILRTVRLVSASRF